MIESESQIFSFRGQAATICIMRNDGFCWGRIQLEDGTQLDVMHKHKDMYNEEDEYAMENYIRLARTRPDCVNQRRDGYENALRNTPQGIHQSDRRLDPVPLLVVAAMSSYRIAMRLEGQDHGEFKVLYVVRWEDYDGAEYYGDTIDQAIESMLFDSRKHHLGPYEDRE